MKINTVQDVRDTFLDLYRRKQFTFVDNKTGSETIEIVSAHFIADRPTIFGEPNHDYIERETQWYDSMSLNVNDIPGGPPKIWAQVADKEGLINSNYGWCIYGAGNYSQFNSVLAELKKSKESRRAIMIYTRPNMHLEYNKNGRSDFICTNTVQYLIRDNKLVTHVTMRSNDSIFGYANDYAWQRLVSIRLLSQLKEVYSELNLGEIFWTAGSLHIYQRHFKLLDELI